MLMNRRFFSSAYCPDFLDDPFRLSNPKLLSGAKTLPAATSPEITCRPSARAKSTYVCN